MRMHESIADIIRVLSQRHPGYGLAGLAMMLATAALIVAMSDHGIRGFL